MRRHGYHLFDGQALIIGITKVIQHLPYYKPWSMVKRGGHVHEVGKDLELGLEYVRYSVSPRETCLTPFNTVHCFECCFTSYVVNMSSSNFYAIYQSPLDPGACQTVSKIANNNPSGLITRWSTKSLISLCYESFPLLQMSFTSVKETTCI
jgi:hypothetical protein